MYKVVIIDDEPIIVDGLKRRIDWAQWNCEVVGTAGNGQQGLEIIREHQPDILFSDICMARMNGLNMIASIISQFPHMEIAILTGHRNFDYAQQAIRLGVKRYLLNPSKMSELEEAIQTMVNHLDAYARKYEEIEDQIAFSESDEAEEESTEAHLANSFIVKNALIYIEHNYMNKFKLSDVADKVYISQWYLSKLLNRHTGHNFSEILNNIRIENAKKLLENPELRIGDIAEQVGFLDVAHFSRVFKKLEGISANQYRNTILGKANTNRMI